MLNNFAYQYVHNILFILAFLFGFIYEQTDQIKTITSLDCS